MARDTAAFVAVAGSAATTLIKPIHEFSPTNGARGCSLNAQRTLGADSLNGL